MKLLKGIFILTNLLLIIATLGAYLASSISPKITNVIPSLGLIFPALILGNILYFLIGLIWQSKLAIMSLLVLFLGFPYIQNTIAFATSTKLSKQGQTLNVATYNMQFSKPIAFLDGTAQQKMIAEFDDFLTRINHLAILGVQECGWRTKERIEQAMDFPYQHFIPNIYTGIYSKYPIINKGFVDFGQQINKCLWADIAIGQDTIRFYTAHLAPNRHDGIVPLILEQEKKEEVDYWKIWGIFQHYQPFALKRSKEATMIRAHQQQSPYPCIISGDFNDPPQTFMYATISKGLKDTFLEAGMGFGGTHGGPVPGLRIDYILTDSIFRISKHQILDKVFSDHYMVETTLQF